MTTLERTAGFATSGWAAAALVVARAAIGLAAHGLAHPLQPATIRRSTGRVAPR